MKVRYHQSNSQFLTHSPTRGFWRVVLPLVLALLMFFLLPGILAAQEAGEGSGQGVVSESNSTALAAGAEPSSPAPLNEQAVAAAVAAAQPGLSGEAVPQHAMSRELRPDRLWLLPRHAELADLLHRAARQALQHPDCNEILYGSLNEFKTDRIGTSFTILCMKDARTTFNQVFFADDLLSEEELDDAEVPDGADDLERLRQMMSPAGQTGDPAAPGQNPAIVPEDLPAPTVF